jgi:hypothetical protein
MLVSAVFLLASMKTSAHKYAITAVMEDSISPTRKVNQLCVDVSGW